MKAYQPVFVLARKSLLVLGGVALVCLALVLGLRQLAESLQTGLVQAQATLQVQKSLLETKEADLANVREHIAQYSALRDQGLVGEPDRALWVEQLQDAYRRAQLPSGLALRLQPPKLLVESTVPGAVPDPGQSEPLAHDLEVDMRNVVESDVLALIHDYRTQVKGRFRVNFCKMGDPLDTGISAQCVLRFITVPVPPAPVM